MPSEKTSKKTGKGKGTANAKAKLRKNASGKGNASKAIAEVPAEGQKVGAGRPSEYDPTVAADFCRRISLGRTVRAVTADDDMPAASTIYRWLEAQPEFRVIYAAAKELHCDAIAEEMLTIADHCRFGTTTTEKEWGTEVKTGDMIERARLQVDARKWYLSKVMPKKFGDKVEQTLVNDSEQPFTVTIDVKSMKIEELKGFIRDQTHGKKN